jgi:biopolymer transport protein ExbD
MAELNHNQNAPRGKVRSRKLTPTVDLTAMVDLAFLLITFFMLTTSLAKPKSMELAMPESKGNPSRVDPNRTMTILIGENSKAQCYMGEFDAQKTKTVMLGTRALRDELSIKKAQVFTYAQSTGKPDRGLIVLIKPGKASNYGNLVDVLDEMAVSRIGTYAIVDIAPDEAKLLIR